MDSQKKYVSASTMKSLEQCSWKYYTDKHLKVPEKNNDGARRGTICHALLEYLQNEKHRDNYDRVIKANDMSGDSACLRLTRRHFEVADMDDKSEDNFDLVKKMMKDEAYGSDTKSADDRLRARAAALRDQKSKTDDEATKQRLAKQIADIEHQRDML